MAEQLTPAQALAVSRPGGPILVSAAAGSGKTKVIVERLMGQILRPDQECSINEFLIITFTKKAAAELRARIARELAARLALDPENRHLQKQQSRIYLTQISTVHAFCAELLREFSYELNIPADFRMLEQTEAETLRARIADELLEERYAEIDTDPALRQLVDGLGAGRDDRRVPGLILGVYTTAQCNLYPGPWLEACEAGLDTQDLHGAEQTPWGRYLLDGLRDCAAQQAAALEALKAELDRSDSLQKYCPLFAKNAAALRDLAERERWDEALAALPGALDFGRLPPVRDCPEPELQARAKALRELAKDQLRRWGEEFYGSSAQVLGDLALTAGTLKALFALTQDFAARFAAEKRRLHALDFNDLEHLALELLLEPDGRTPTPAARRISQRYREIMVDEYQDTNQVQDAIFRAVSQEGRNRFMVGDVKQSIYRFRLADPGIFLDKYRRYPQAEEAEPTGPQRILLSHNFRSGAPILEAVNAVFGLCMSPKVGGLAYGPQEALRPGRPLEPLPQTQVELHCLTTQAGEGDTESPEKNRAEAAFAARRVRAMLDEGTLVRGEKGLRPLEPRDLVILLRSPKNVSGFYLEALQRLGIPAASDTGESILDSAEVEALLCLLKVLDNAHQDIPLTGALLSPIFAVPAAELARAGRVRRDRDLYDSLLALENPAPALAGALERLNALRDQAQRLPLHSLLELIRELTGLEAVYGAMENGAARLRDLAAFYELAAAFSEGGRKSLHQFLTHIEELRAQGGVPAPRPQTDAVTIMSIHKSKGLEFPVVLLCGLSRRFNLDDLKVPVQFHSQLGAGCAVYDPETHTRFSSIAKAAISRQTKAENISEELRVLYVAMTRAKDMLIMTHCAQGLEAHLKDLALGLSPETAPALAARAGCMGDWVLLTALLRTEAGALHALGARPQAPRVSALPWHIAFHVVDQAENLAGRQSTRPAAEALDPEALAQSLAFRYSRAGAETVPAKLTATQLKGRFLDQEADDGRPRPEALHIRLAKPSLLEAEKPLSPAQRGTAMHQAMQYLDFGRTDSLEQIQAQLEHMVAEAFLSPAQAQAVDPEKLLRVFQGPLGGLIRSADRVLREFKFSLLTEAERYYPQAAGDRVLLQGVTDCCLFRDGAITVVDFKTDRVKAGEETEAGEKYRPQLAAYSLALSRIFGLPVRRRLLYFFATDALVEL